MPSYAFHALFSQTTCASTAMLKNLMSFTMKRYNPMKAVLLIAAFILFMSPQTAKAQGYNITLTPEKMFNEDAFEGLSGSILIIFLFMLLAFLIFIAEKTTIPAIAFLAALYGFFISMLLFAVISSVIGVIMAITSGVYALRILVMER